MWHKVPAVKILLPLLAGIITGLHTAFPAWIPVCFWLLLAVLTLFMVLPPLSRSYSLLLVRGIVIQFIVFVGGMCLVQMRNPTHRGNFYGNFLQNGESILEARIISPPEDKPKTKKVMVSVEMVHLGETHHSTSGRAIIYIQKDFGFADLKYGDVLYLKNLLHPPSEPKNPNEFNYKKYLSNQGIYYTGFYTREDAETQGENRARGQWKIIYSCRLHFEELLQQHIHSKDARDVSAALLLGARSAIDDDIVSAYADTGTMHILSVSGLHVGILYFILDLILGFFTCFRSSGNKNKYLRAGISIVVIWFYASITGMSPSVSRSAVMFTFLIIGKLNKRHVNSYNILAASAIPLLIVNPFMITQVGFQLSYLAILGIIAFQAKLGKLYHPKTKTGKYIADLTTVSLAAQAGTVPLTIYYFHQFPNYFILSNILAIPISFLVLVAGIIFFALSFVPAISVVTGWILEMSLRTLNATVVMLDKIPGAVSDGLHLTLSQAIIFYGGLLSTAIFIHTKNKDYGVYMLGLYTFLLLSFGLVAYRQSHQAEVTIYSLPGAFAISEIQGRSATLYSNRPLSDTAEDYTFHIQNDLTCKGIRNRKFIHLSDSATLAGEKNIFAKYIQFDTTLICILDKGFTLPRGQVNGVDELVVSGNPYVEIPALHKHFPHARVIFAADNSMRNIERWKKECVAVNSKYFDMKTEGYVSIP